MGEIATEVKIEDISPVKKKLSLEIPWFEVKTALDNAYKAIGQHAKVKGFRPGKTPRKVLESLYKKQAEEDAISNIISESYVSALETNDINPVTQPVINQGGIEADKVFSYSATFEVVPPFEPKDYHGLEIEKEVYEVTDEDVATRLDRLRDMYSTLETVEDGRGVSDGDFVSVAFEGSVDGAVKKELTAENYLLQIGSKTFVPGFEEQMLGVKKGENVNVTVTFPDDYHAKELAGKEGIFTVSVKDIQVKKVPELDEAFVKNLQAYETLDELKEEVRKSLEEEYKERTKTGLRNDLVSKMIEKNDIDVPPSFVERQIYYMVMDAERRMIGNGMPRERAAQISSNLHERFRDDAERMVRTSLLLGKIAEKESIAVSDEEVNERIRETAQQYGQNYETVRAAYEKNNVIERIKDEILEQKTLDFLEEHATIKIVTRTADKETGEA
ncbi:MAG: trigger factor [Deltaproteobacteria bacterium]|nr:trigger factor [Deltaproteobacteria bacterium]MBN2688760.1 trigger factor [Deltaproteobacteria bacterium]